MHLTETRAAASGTGVHSHDQTTPTHAPDRYPSMKMPSTPEGFDSPGAAELRIGSTALKFVIAVTVRFARSKSNSDAGSVSNALLPFSRAPKRSSTAPIANASSAHPGG